MLDSVHTLSLPLIVLQQRLAIAHMRFVGFMRTTRALVPIEPLNRLQANQADRIERTIGFLSEHGSAFHKGFR
ncbi:hypothetical protein GRAN_1476 [Granulicella sibirica]|uniref:Uncharacterized protein n=1 Tax=Granulicella sibirica TaxID=2479048 RepID=A0A4Q0T8V9_9BACT|nr:hypothetical protein GRAN_1476 [Granulicella sibirica]